MTACRIIKRHIPGFVLTVRGVNANNYLELFSMMSLQELRGTLFSYLQPRLNSFLGAQEHEIPILGKGEDLDI